MFSLLLALCAVTVGCSGRVAQSMLPSPSVNATHARDPRTAPYPMPGPSSEPLPFQDPNLLPVCNPASGDGAAECDTFVRTDVQTLTDPNTPAVKISGMGPAELRQAYRFPLIGAGTPTVAIVDAFDHPSAESDLAIYRTTFGLPPCSSSTGCFRKVNQRGSTSSFPAVQPNWAEEISLDLEMASAVCPTCRLLLVEADSNRFVDLIQGIATAVQLGASAVSNSYYAPEFPSQTQYDAILNRIPSAVITASAGDSAFGATFPASSSRVIAVGGTTLVLAPGTARGWTETAWPGGSAGCSRYIRKPAWQHDSGCRQRTMNDVAMVADPYTGVAVYASVVPPGQLPGWSVLGGTSVGAPIVAAAVALAGVGSTGTAATAYAHPNAFFPVLTGSDGTCRDAYLCTAGPGYNGPAGLGTPNGVAGL